MASVITIAGEQLFAAKAQANEQLDIDTFIFANVPNQDPSAPINREEGIPTANIVYQQNVQQVGRINDNVVVYSTVLDSITGPFEFNWVGLYSSVNQKLVAINHVPTVTKTATAPGAAGNTLNRNFGIEYSGIADLTGITVDAGTWQLDFTARLSGMDLLTQQLAADMNGKDWFIADGLKVVPRTTANSFSVTPGVGYVSGLRVELKQEHILIVQSYPQFVYVDAWFSGNANSTWSPQLAFTVTNTEMDDYVDPSGAQHYVYKLAAINAADGVEDLRSNKGIAEKLKKTRISTSVAEIATGKFEIGSILEVVDNGNAPRIVIEGGVPDGHAVLFAGENKTAVLQSTFLNPVEWFGCVSDLEFTTDESGVVLSALGTDNSDAWQAAADWSAANKAIIVGSGKGYRFETHGVIMKSGTNIKINKGTYLMQDYQVVVEPKSESLFRNEAWNTANEDSDIHMSGGSYTSGPTITGGSYITLNKLVRYSIMDIYCRKFTENICLNIGGEDFHLSGIHIVNKVSDVGKIDGIHFEYIENATGGDFNIESQDDCLAFAYYPAIIPPRSPAEAIANVTHGRDLPSRNISFTGGVLKSEIANAVRVGNWANFEDLNQHMMPDGRYENLILNGFACTKNGTTGTMILLEDYRHGPSEITQPHDNIQFNGFVINDFTSETESLISIRGNAFIKGFYDYDTAGNDRNFNVVSFNGLRGSHESYGQTYDFNGASKVTLTDCDIKRTVATNNELITQLVDSIRLEGSYINSKAESATGNACFFRDFKEVIINGGKIEGNGLEVAGVRLQQTNLGQNIGRVNINGTIFRNVIGGVYAVSALNLETLQLDGDFSGISGSVTNSLLSATVSDRGKWRNLNGNITVNNNNNYAKRTGGTGSAALEFTANNNINIDTKIADFPIGCFPDNNDPIRINIISTSGQSFVCDYSSTVGLRTRVLIPAGTYFANFSYRAKG